ncbi:hypothetical protein HN011_006839, partial [Eciton burchellii]
IFPARAPSSEIEIAKISNNYGILPGLDRTAYQQAGYQVLALVVTFGISVVSGLITGLAMCTIIYGWIANQQQFDDKIVWELEEPYESLEKNQDNNQM